jgi:hypothetical protein
MPTQKFCVNLFIESWIGISVVSHQPLSCDLYPNLRANSFRTVPPGTYLSRYFCASRLAAVLFPQAVIPAKQITMFFLRACLAVMS